MATVLSGSLGEAGPGFKAAGRAEMHIKTQVWLAGTCDELLSSKDVVVVTRSGTMNMPKIDVKDAKRVRL